ncbi:hypothetical protein HIM_10378 [Hirsutella minnesotensis 3608]|uniref:SMP domain-containing protein n=1 Tax=Hirsutella minnesotensis 3608 TaxID=1043627 RepID=A0A0F7ZK58_9HYPO|nr:hypothetical protein HIM_10378 [Hirsutella minnesotensis 3608]
MVRIAGVLLTFGASAFAAAVDTRSASDVSTGVTHIVDRAMFDVPLAKRQSTGDSENKIKEIIKKIEEAEDSHTQEQIAKDAEIDQKMEEAKALRTPEQVQRDDEIESLIQQMLDGNPGAIGTPSATGNPGAIGTPSATSTPSATGTPGAVDNGGKATIASRVGGE